MEYQPDTVIMYTDDEQNVNAIACFRLRTAMQLGLSMTKRDTDRQTSPGRYVGENEFRSSKRAYSGLIGSFLHFLALLASVGRQHAARKMTFIATHLHTHLHTHTHTHTHTHPHENIPQTISTLPRYQDATG